MRQRGGVRAHLWINRVEGAARKPDPDYDRVDAGAVLVCSDRDGSHRSRRSPRCSHPDRGRASATTVRSQSPLRHPEDHATRTAAEPVPKSACSPFAVRDDALAVPGRDDRRVDRPGDRYSAALCSASCRSTRASSAVAKLLAVIQTKVTVLRDGHEVELPHDALVPGDVIVRARAPSSRCASSGAFPDS